MENLSGENRLPAENPDTGIAVLPLPPPSEQDFSETLPARLRRVIMGCAYALMPKRIGDAPFLFAQTLWRMLVPGPTVPGAASMWKRPQGYGGPVHDDTADGVLAGMKAGFYQVSFCGPRKWWSPDERAVMMVRDVHIQRRFRRSMKNAPFRVTVDRAFYEVVKNCAAPRRKIHVTWIHPSTRRLLQEMHEKGYAHSVEVWNAGGELVGGVFGVALGPVFTAESMFHTENDASKLAILSLYQHLEALGVTAVDHQVMRPWVEQMGARLVSRAEYQNLLAQPAPEGLPQGPWTTQFSTADTMNWQPGEGVRDAA